MHSTQNVPIDAKGVETGVVKKRVNCIIISEYSTMKPTIIIKNNETKPKI